MEVNKSLTPALGGPAEKLVRARVVNSIDDLLPNSPVVLHLGIFPFVPDAVRVRGVFDHSGNYELTFKGVRPPAGVLLRENDDTVVYYLQFGCGNLPATVLVSCRQNKTER